ncbi:MAG: hypothetical protein KBH07_02550 [Flavobacteriales bacterium]|nr:hypothetical protein [Flavobacteriales bacterium]MBP9079676.1 hypothetical protein [Flavobacteriales bacterium]
MIGKKAVLLVLGVVIAAFLSCRKDVPVPLEPVTVPAPVSPVVFNMDSVPYPTLSTYNFFEAPMAELRPVHGVLPYAPITPAFGDYAHKVRFVWMPPGAKANYVADHKALDFPEGTILIKSPYYDKVLPNLGRRVLDTRLMIKKNGTWTFAIYVWNEEQTEAYLDMSGTNIPLTWVDDNGGSHEEVFRIPSAGECLACHMDHSAPTPISAKPQNLNSTFAYAGGPMNQLAKWTSQGYLAGGYPANIETIAKWDDPNETLDRRVRAYLDMNCSHCHYDGGFCSYRPMRFAWHDSSNPANLGICIPPDDPFAPGVDYIVKAGSANRSMLYYRMNSVEEAVRMPLLERTVRDTAALELIKTWINAMPDTCS